MMFARILFRYVIVPSHFPPVCPCVQRVKRLFLRIRRCFTTISRCLITEFPSLFRYLPTVLGCFPVSAVRRWSSTSYMVSRWLRSVSPGFCTDPHGVSIVASYFSWVSQDLNRVLSFLGDPLRVSGFSRFSRVSPIVFPGFSPDLAVASHVVRQCSCVLSPDILGIFSLFSLISGSFV